MALVFVRPSIQHKAANVLSSTSSTGLTVQEPEPATTNAGTLRLQCSGAPTAAEAITVELSSGGAPFGYAVGGSTAAVGVAAKWRRDADAASLQRGYIDGDLFGSVLSFANYDSLAGISTPRELGDGTLGFLFVDQASPGAVKFVTMQENGDKSGGLTLPATAYAAYSRADLVVLPSGRLVACILTAGSSGEITTCYSDDLGVTWATLGVSTSGVGRDMVCAEVVGDDIVLLQADTTGITTGYVMLSRDAGATFTTITTAMLDRPRTCAHGGKVYVAERSANKVGVRTITPGGGLSAVVDTGAGCFDTACIIARDDGTLWVFGDTAGGSGTIDYDSAVSIDGGVTWTAMGNPAMTTGTAAYANAGYQWAVGCMFGARMVIAASVDATTGTATGPHFFTFGEWSNVGAAKAPGVYLPLDFPEALGWTRNDTGAGATVTNGGPLNVVSAVADYTSWVAPTTIYGASTSAIRARFAVQVNSGGSLATKYIRWRAEVTDGVDAQGIQISFLTTGARCTDINGTQIGSDLVLNMSADPREFLVGLLFDGTAAGSGAVSVWYRTLNGDTWTAWFVDQAVSEVLASTGLGLLFGAAAGAVTDSDWYFLSVDDSRDYGLATDTATLDGRPLSAAYDYALTSGIRLGAYGNGGVPADTYALATRYTYGPDRVWSDLRPSSRTESAADGGNWSVTFDAGTGALFRGNLAAAFGTNMKIARWQMNASDSWGAPSVDVALDATLSTFTVGAGVRGVGYVGRTGSPNWRPHQWRSNGDSRRYFIEVNSVSYEITDNDEDRIYVDGVDFGASGVNASGTATLYGDRMAGTFTFGLYRYARFAVTSGQQTADDVYRLGTPIVGKQWTPNQLYDNGFVDRIEPNVTTTDAENGSSISYRRGPAIDTLSIQWPPLDRLRADVEIRLRDFYRSIDGALTPVVLWRDTSSLATLSLVQVREVYSATNVLGELDNAVTRIDQLVLREVW